MQHRHRASLLVCGVALGLALLVPGQSAAPAHADALCDAMKARFGPGYPCLNVPTNTFTPTAPTAPATTGAGGTSGGGPQAGSNIGPGPGEGNGTPIVPVPGQTPAAAAPSQPQQTPAATTPPQTAPTTPPATTPAPSTRSQAAPSSSTSSAPTPAATGQAAQSSATTPSLAADNTGSTTPWWPIGAALAIALLALLGIGALVGARRGLFGSPFTLLTPTPASAVTHPRPPIVVPPEATAPAVPYREPDTSTTPTTDGGGSGPDTSSGGQSGGAGTTYTDPPTDSGTYGGGTGTGTTGGGTTGTGTGSGGPSNGNTVTTQTPPPQTPPTTPPPSADDPTRAKAVGFFTDILKPIIGSAEAAAALAELFYELSQLVLKYGLEWLRQHPLDTQGLLASQLPAWVIARIGDLDHAITQFFAKNKEPKPDRRHENQNPAPVRPEWGDTGHADMLPKDGTNPYIPPKSGRGGPVRKRGSFIDKKGRVWNWDPHAHGGPHWDVTDEDGDNHVNVYPDGYTR